MWTIVQGVPADTIEVRQVEVRREFHPVLEWKGCVETLAYNRTRTKAIVALCPSTDPNDRPKPGFLHDDSLTTAIFGFLHGSRQAPGTKAIIDAVAQTGLVCKPNSVRNSLIRLRKRALVESKRIGRKGLLWRATNAVTAWGVPLKTRVSRTDKRR